MSSKKRTKELKFKACDVSVPLPINPEPNSIYIVKDGSEFDIFPVDADGNYLTLTHPTPVSVYGSELNLFDSSSILSNSTNTLLEVLNVNTTSLPLGKYVVKVDYSWNSNCTQHDFESFLMVDGSAISNDSSGLIHKEEPKDSAGQWNGTNSLQMLHFSREYTIDVLTPGTKNVVFSFRSSKDNVMASIWDLNIKIFRIN